MRFEKRGVRRKGDSKKGELEGSFAVKFRRIILTAILEKELHMMKKFPRRKLTESVNAKIYKSQSKQSTSLKSQRQQTSELFSKRSSLQVSLKVIDVKKQNIQVSQISTAEFISRLRIIRYLYENHPSVEFSHIVRNIYKAVIDHFNNIDSDIESYIYCFSSLKSIEFSIIGFILDIFSTPNSCDLFRLTVRISQSFPNSNHVESENSSGKPAWRRHQCQRLFRRIYSNSQQYLRPFSKDTQDMRPQRLSRVTSKSKKLFLVYTPLKIHSKQTFRRKWKQQAVLWCSQRGREKQTVSHHWKYHGSQKRL